MERHQPAAHRSAPPHRGPRHERHRAAPAGGDARAHGRRHQSACHLLLAVLAAPAGGGSVAGGDPGRAADRGLANVPGAAGVRRGGDRGAAQAAQLRRALSRTAARGDRRSAWIRGGAAGRHRGDQGTRRPGAYHAPDECPGRGPGVSCQTRLQLRYPGVAGGERGDGDRHRLDDGVGRYADAARRHDPRHPLPDVQLHQLVVLAVRGPGASDGGVAEGGRQPGPHSAAAVGAQLARRWGTRAVPEPAARHRPGARQLPLPGHGAGH